MITVVLDKNNYYTGSYAKIGDIPGGVKVESLPPKENEKCYRLDDVEKTSIINTPVYEYFILTKPAEIADDGLIISEEEINVITEEEFMALEDADKEGYTRRIKVDENGDIVYEEKVVTETVKEWVFDESKIDEINAESLEYLKLTKKKELGDICTSVIYSGTDVKFTDGTVKHFSLEMKDQFKISTLYSQAVEGAEKLFWHSDGDYCTSFTKEEMILIGNICLGYVTYHETLINHLNRYIESLTTAEEIEVVTYSPESLNGEALEKYNATLQEISESNPSFASIVNIISV